MSDSRQKRGLERISGVKESRNAELETKRAKTVPVDFCHHGCGYLADPFDKRSGPVCCSTCPESPHAANESPQLVGSGFHTEACEKRWFSFRRSVDSIKTWEDANRRLIQVYKSRVKPIIDPLLVGVEGIASLIIEYASPALETRPYWRPVFGPATQDRPIAMHDSKFSGLPQLLVGDDWPQCKSCNTLLPLFFQLNVNQLPTEYRDAFMPHVKHLRDHLIQFFCCTCCDDCFDAFSPGQFVRVVPIVTDEKLLKTREFLDEMTGFLHENHQISTPELAITSWRKSVFAEGPHIKHEQKSTTEVSPLEFTSDCLGESFIEFEDDCSMCTPSDYDKLYGWPAWIENSKYPKCKKCDSNMVYLFQYDARNINESFGDEGIGWLFICQYHYDVVAFQTQSAPIQ